MPCTTTSATSNGIGELAADLVGLHAFGRGFLGDTHRGTLLEVTSERTLAARGVVAEQCAAVSDVSADPDPTHGLRNLPLKATAASGLQGELSPIAAVAKPAGTTDPNPWCRAGFPFGDADDRDAVRQTRRMTLPLLDRVPRPFDADVMYDAFVEWSGDRGLALYPAQDEAVIEIVSGANVILSTPTGTGKSLVAVAAHAASVAQGGRSYYTAPDQGAREREVLPARRDLRRRRTWAWSPATAR